MTEKGYLILKNLVKEYRELFALIVVGEDKAVKKDFKYEIIKICDQYGIPYLERNQFSGVFKTEYVLAVSWKWIINHQKDKLIVFHDSLLPRYRGFSPLVSCLINEEKEIGVTV